MIDDTARLLIALLLIAFGMIRGILPVPGSGEEVFIKSQLVTHYDPETEDLSEEE